MNYTLDNLASLAMDRNRKKAGEYLCFSGGITLFKKTFYEKVGGFDERFEGWGAEDDAMDIKIKAITSQIITIEDQLAYHLWHPRNAQRKNNFYYKKNSQLLRAYYRMERADFITLCHMHRNSMGRKNRIKDIIKI